MSNYVISQDGELYHYGVKGTKWGVRRAKKTNSKIASAYRKKAKDERDAQGELKAINAYRKSKGKKPTAIANKQMRASQRAQAKYESKAAKFEANNKQLDKAMAVKQKRYDFRATRSKGARVATAVLMMDPFVNRNYEAMVAAGSSKKGAAVQSYATSLVAGPIGSLAVSSLVESQHAKRMG